jgi:hypothetical protein
MLKHITEKHLNHFGELRLWGFNYLAIKGQYEKLSKDRAEGLSLQKANRRRNSAKKR